MFKICEPRAMIDGLRITPSPNLDRGNGLETRPGIEPSEKGNAIPNLFALAGILAL
ncbi:MAG: hypothetical protein JHC28_02725 [Thermoprotei archaeon]|nr:hypothetical protein [Thermoprotei archaeon]